MLQFKADVQGEGQLIAALAQFENSFHDLHALWPKLADVFYGIEREQFDSEGGHGAGGWAALSGNYAKQKAKEFPGRKILQATGALMESLTTKDAQYGIYEEADAALTLGSALPYAQFHQSGTSYMPARPEIALTDQDRARFINVALRELTGIARSLGFEPNLPSGLGF